MQHSALDSCGTCRASARSHRQAPFVDNNVRMHAHPPARPAHHLGIEPAVSVCLRQRQALSCEDASEDALLSSEERGRRERAPRERAHA